MLTSVSIQRDGTTLLVTTPPNREFVAELRVLGAQWIAERHQWVCDSRDEERVRALCLHFFGTDGTAVGELCDLRVEVAYIDGPDLSVNRRVLIGRNSKGQPWTPRGVAVVSGSVPIGTGTIGQLAPPVVIEIRDVPVVMANAFRSAIAEMTGVRVVERVEQ